MAQRMQAWMAFTFNDNNEHWKKFQEYNCSKVMKLFTFTTVVFKITTLYNSLNSIMFTLQ